MHLLLTFHGLGQFFLVSLYYVLKETHMLHETFFIGVIFLKKKPIIFPKETYKSLKKKLKKNK